MRLGIGAAVAAIVLLVALSVAFRPGTTEVEPPFETESAETDVERADETNERPSSVEGESYSPTTSFIEDFNMPYRVEEAGDMRSSTNTKWWLSSGAYFYSENGVGRTVTGALAEEDRWRMRYDKSNPTDTDDGYYPQNIFRLVQRQRWEDMRQQAYFKVVNDNLSDSEYRNGSNGLLFFNRYHDQFNLYYTGIRVDGYVTIKKKIDGVYYTLSYKPFITGQGTYDRDDNPTLLPKNTWIGLRTDVRTNADGTVTIEMYVDIGRTGAWTLAASAVDDGVTYGGAVFDDGHAGIRTDFMDVQIDEYRVTDL